MFTAPLMPPCAQTECERLTGKNDTTSTDMPSSAIFMVAASPANPPPITITRCLLINISLFTKLQKVRKRRWRLK